MKRVERTIQGCKTGRITRRQPTFDELIPLVYSWFDERGLHDPVMQMVKVQEEIGELSHEIVRSHFDGDDLVDAIGDSFITLIGMCHHLNIKPSFALNKSYNEIKDRKGKVINNNFIKEKEMKEDWEKMQNGEWKCACCGSFMEPVDKTHVECPTCHLKLRFKDGKIQCKGNMMKDYE